MLSLWPTHRTQPPCRHKGQYGCVCQFRHMGLPTSGILICPAYLRRGEGLFYSYFYSYALFARVCAVVSKFLNRNRNISTSRLHALPRFHLKPINVIISHGFVAPPKRSKIPNLEAGFPLRCFQRLSIPDIATQQCPWQDS
jgi:hypothetical protein